MSQIDDDGIYVEDELLYCNVPKMPRLIRDHNTSGDTIIYNPLYFGGPRTDIINIINIKAKYSC